MIVKSFRVKVDESPLVSTTRLMKTAGLEEPQHLLKMILQNSISGLQNVNFQGCSPQLTKHFTYLKWRYSPIWAICKAYVREEPPPKWPYKVHYLHFRFLIFLVNSELSLLPKQLSVSTVENTTNSQPTERSLHLSNHSWRWTWDLRGMNITSPNQKWR